MANVAVIGAQWGDEGKGKIDNLLVHHNALLRGLGAPEAERGPLLASLIEIAPRILPFAEAVWQRLDEARRGGKRILFEGAQGVMLDVDHGTYPYVTSSNTVAGQAAARLRIRPPAGGGLVCNNQGRNTLARIGPLPTQLTH